MTHKLLFSISVFLLFSTVALADPAADEMGEFPGGGAPATFPETNYISPKNPKLNSREQHALDLATQYAGRQIQPVLGNGGKVVFMHGATVPTVIAAPMQVCDVEFQAGETVNEVVIGDSARWMLETGTSGSSAGEVTHLLIKPIDAGLETSAVVTTDRRTYHLKLVSRTKGHTPYVGFTYMDDINRQIAANNKAKAKEEKWNSGEFDGRSVDLSKLNFNYDLSGDSVNWKPERVYDDGQQTFISLPPRAASGEIPALLVRNGKKDVIVNYRVQNSTMIVDGLFDKIVLVVGVGGDQKKVEVRRKM